MSELAREAMLVELNISQCTFRKLDKKATRKVTSDFHAKEETARVNKVIIAKENHKEIYQTVNQARGFHYTNTLPFSDTGPRILPVANYWDYTEAMRGYREKFETAIKSFMENYSAFVAQARIDLGDMFDTSDYPSLSKLESMFRFRIGFMPMPDSGHFLVDLSNKEMERIKAELDVQNNAVLQNSVQHLWERLYKNVQNMAERLSENRLDKDGNPKPAIFRDSLVENLIEQCGLLTKLNLAHDPNLERMRAEVEAKLCKHDAQTLRNLDDVREETAQEANEILKAMEAYCGKLSV